MGQIGDLLKHTIEASWLFYAGLVLAFWKILPKLIVKKAVSAVRQVLEEPISEVNSTLNNIEKKQELIKQGTLAILHYRIYEDANQYIAQGYITTEQMDDLEHLFSPYEELGGNGTAKKLYKKCLDLPMRYKEGKND